MKTKTTIAAIVGVLIVGISLFWSFQKNTARNEANLNGPPATHGTSAISSGSKAPSRQDQLGDLGSSQKVTKELIQSLQNKVYEKTRALPFKKVELDSELLNRIRESFGPRRKTAGVLGKKDGKLVRIGDEPVTFKTPDEVYEYLRWNISLVSKANYIYAEDDERYYFSGLGNASEIIDFSRGLAVYKTGGDIVGWGMTP